jgi:hypothetical protein
VDEFGGFSVEGSGRGFGKVEPIRDQWQEPLYRINAGARYVALDAATLYGNYAFGQATPRDGSLTEAHVAPDDEQRHTVDAGIIIDAGKLATLTLGGFYAQRDGALVLTGNTYADAEGLEREYYANRNITQYGLELECRTQALWQHIVLFADLLLMNSRIETPDGDTGDYEEAPDQVLGAGIYANVGTVDINAFARYVGSYKNNRFSADGSAQPLGDYVDLGLTVGITLGQERRTRVYGKLENVLNDEYSTVVGYYDPGRRFSAGLQHTF